MYISFIQVHHVPRHTRASLPYTELIYICICNIYSTVGRSIADIYNLSAIFIYCMESAQQANFSRALSCMAICTNGGHYKMAAEVGRPWQAFSGRVEKAGT